MVVHARSRPDDGPARCAVIAGRKVGPAVARNRAKRRIRAGLQQSSLPHGMDLVVTARASAVTAPFTDLRAELDRLILAAVGRCRR